MEACDACVADLLDSVHHEMVVCFAVTMYTNLRGHQ